MPPAGRPTMRDLLVSLIIFSLMPVCFRRPYIGLVMFSWLAYMRVQDLTWGFARGMRWSFYLALLTFSGWFFSPVRRRFFLPDARTYLMITMAVLIGIGIILSNAPDKVWQFKQYTEFVKIIAIALFTTGIVSSREHLRLLIWVIALSLGFYGVKNGIWGLKTLAQVPIIRGPGGMLYDNNDFSLALAMAVPMLWCIGISEQRPTLRRAFLVCVPLTAFTVLLTQSRGGMLSLVAGVGVLLWRSKHRATAIALSAVIGLVGIALMPPQMYERFASIKDYKEDGSANARFRSWAVARRMAMDNPFFGVGLANFRPNYLVYEPEPTPAELGGQVFVAHNSYLQVWAECGTPALFIYLVLIFMSFVTVWRVRALARRRYNTSWIINYATMFEASLVTFVIGAMFLNRAHFDLIYHWVAIVMLFGVMARQDMEDGQLYPVREEDDDETEPLSASHAGGFGARPKVRGFRTAGAIAAPTSGFRKESLGVGGFGTRS